ncbi:MAG TPA: DUF1729 domain-containing protein [Actinomycetota bacterium]|nr:DUF1729 domain-containing protein [Actinomycetota bacterium]
MTAIDTPSPTAYLPRHDPRPGSVLAAAARTGDVLLVFPGVQASWPAALDGVLKGRPWLEEWLTDVAERVARWTHTPDVQDSGWFARDIRDVLTPTCEPATAVQAPFMLAGSVLVNLASLAAFEADGGHVLTGHPVVRATGHSAGLISAAAAGGGPAAAAEAIQLALLLGITATDVAGSAGAAASASVLVDIDPDAQPSPMAAIGGPRRDRLRTLLNDFGGGVELALANGLDRHVLSGAPGDLRDFRTYLQTLAGEETASHKAGRRPGSALSFEWEALPNPVPFHHSALVPAAGGAAAWARRSGIGLAPRLTIIDPATGRALDPERVHEDLAASVLSRPQDWAGTLLDAVSADTVVISLGINRPVHGLTERALRGSGALVLQAEAGADRRNLTTPGATPARTPDYSVHRPMRDGDRIVTKHTRLTGRSPFILAGMTPTTVDAGIVAAAANAGHVAELAGGGQVTEAIFAERMTELGELLEPGQEVVFNAMHLDPYLWGLHLGSSRLVQRARTAGAPLCGVTVSAGIPERDEALELLDELQGLGLWLNAFKPGNVKQVLAALEIAEATDRPLWLHLEGGQAGGHHSWENLEDLLLATYDQVRAQDNVVLVVGGGVGTPQRAAELLTGQWSRKHGVPAMPVDAVLIGTAAMACRESTASSSVKKALASIEGPPSGWVRRAEFAGDMTSGLSGLNADIHFIDNSASRAAALLDEVAGDADAVARRRDEIISALSRTAKPFFGEVAEMTYTGLLQRFVELTALGGHGRYHDGVWLDPTHRSRFHDLLQRAEARLHPNDTGRIPTLFSAPVDDPGAAIAELRAAYPQADSAGLHPADVDYFTLVCRAPGKPVPFVPVIDADVRRWYQSDALWQSHDERYDADQVLIIPGPAAVAGIQSPDEPVADLFDRFETDVVVGLPRTDSGLSPVAAILNAPTVQWAGRTRPNPVLNLAPADQWDVGQVAVYTRGEEYARLIPAGPTRVDLEIGWPGLADGDGTLVLPLEVLPLARGVRVVVTREALAAAGRQVPVAPAPDSDGAAAHAATVGASVRLPDAAMRSIWPGLFETFIAQIPGGMLDLVHLDHRIESVGDPSAAEVIGVTGAARGYRISTRAAAAGARSTDTFFVRQPGGAPSTTEVSENPGTAWQDTPSLLLGAITQTAPALLDTFARVTGDLNPIHRSELVARLAGLPGRIVHGMWTSALGQRAAIELAAGGSAKRLRDWHIRFLAPLLPGAEVTASVRRTGAAHGDLRVEVVLEAGDTTVATAVATVAPPRTAYVFPGQGVQQVGMGMDGYARSQAARDVWEQADAHCRQALGFSILQIVRDNPTTLVAGVPGDAGAQQTYRHPAGVLFLTQFTQVAMATLACAQVAELRERGVFDETAVTAGHSVGEYNALAAVTGTLPLPDLLELVFARGSAMHGLVPRAADGSSQYRLAVVRPHLAGLDHAGADELVRAVAADTGELCEIVNHNLKGKQYAVAGTVGALRELERRIGPGSGKPPFLLVPGIDVPFHSSALTDGVVAFRSHLDRRLPETIDPAALVGRYVPNLHPQPFATTRDYVSEVLRVCDSSALRDLLARWDDLTEAQIARTLLIELLAWQFAMPVRWIETTDVLCTDLGVQRVVEVGVGTQPTLANLFKGALALGSHRGSRPVVLHAEADLAEVLELTEDPVVEHAPVGEDAPEAEVLERPAPAATATAGTPAPDLPVTHADALAALVAARTSLRPEQLQDESIEDLVDGASSRRNQLLMDLGKEFGVSGMDGVHELALTQVAEGLAGKAAGYRFPGPVLRTWLDAETAAALGRAGGTPAAVPARVRDHWGLGDGWAAQVLLAIALGSRDGASKRGGELRTLTGDTPAALIDAAVEAVAAARGVSVNPVSSAAGSSLDAAAVAEVTGAIEDLLADTATTVLRRLERLPAAPEQSAAPTGPDTLTVEYGAEHAEQIAPSFDPRRHVHLGSATTWARAEVDHLVQAVAAGRPLAELAGSLDQIAVHRDADPRIAATLRWYAGRGEVFADAADQVAAAVNAALTSHPTGISTDLAQALAALPKHSPDMQQLAQVAEQLPQRPGPFAGEVALVTGASPGSIALAAVAHLLRGGATVVLVTSSDDERRIAQYRDLERTCAGPGAELHVIRANLASFTDIDRLQEWLTTPATQSVGGTTKQTKPALWPTLVLPFAAGPALGSLADTDAHNAATLRLMLLGVQRLVGGLGERILAAGRTPARVILPMSPNHGTFGGDGSYGDSKAALETVLNRWHAEQSAWAAGTRLVAATIGWVRGTGLMAGNDRIADAAGEALGIHVFTAEQMGALIAAACTPELARFTEQPWRLDLTGGLAGAGDISAVMRDLAGTATGTDPETDEEQLLDALPGVPWALASDTADSFDVQPAIGLDDMVVIAGIAELGPWGASRTRWEAEVGPLSADGVTELAWRMGLITWDPQAAAWLDEDRQPVDEARVRDLLDETVGQRAGLREFETTAGVAAEGTLHLAEVYLDAPVSIAGVTYPAGTAIRVPAARPLQRQVGGQFPTGVDPVRHGLDRSVAESIDPLAAWNLVVSAEALADAGTSAEELSEHVHPGRIGNVQGTGMGGMDSLHKLYVDPLLGTAHANDLLQEALGNVVSAHTNQSLLGGYGPMVHPVAACATAAVSLEEAVDKIRVGKADILLAGGWDDLSSEGINGFADMAATADNQELLAAGIGPRGHSRPGDRRRAGFVESQGGGSFLVMRGSVALRLGLPVRAVVAYAGSFGDGLHTSIPAPGLGALNAAHGGPDSPLARALRAHGLTPDDIAVVSKHDTSTHANDPNEALIHATIQQALGRSEGAPLRVVSQKSVTGHAKGGAAAWQLAGLCDVFATGIVPGNRNLVGVDPQVTPGPLVVDYRPLRRHEPVRAAVLTSLGFGHVSALVALAHPAVFTAAVPEHLREDYLRRSAARRLRGQRALLAARYGGPPVFVRRTQRPARTEEIDLLIGVNE